MPSRLRDVAEHAGVSVRTVSNVVNDFRFVAPQTRARVQASIDLLGYRPNMAARTLRRSQTGLIALVIPEIDSPYFAELAACTVRQAESLGWTVLIDQTDGDAERERRLLHGVRSQLVDGLIFSPWSLPLQEVAARTDTVPLVLLGEHDESSVPLDHGPVDHGPVDHVPVDHVAVDNSAAARSATEHLLVLGRRRIAAVGVQPGRSNATARQRLTGHREALSGAGLPARPELEIAVDALHRADGYHAMRRLLDLPERPDAVFCFTDELALGALRALADEGASVPADVAVVGFDDIQDGHFSTPTLSTISPDKARIAYLALGALQRQLDGSRARERITAPHELIVRQSSGAPKV